MEATKGIKPATPLPWHLDERTVCGWISPPGCNTCPREIETVVAESFTGEDADAAYIVHAANNYGRLVEALRYFAKAADPHGSSQWLGAWSELNALLRELGESE